MIELRREGGLQTRLAFRYCALHSLRMDSPLSCEVQGIFGKVFQRKEMCSRQALFSRLGAEEAVAEEAISVKECLPYYSGNCIKEMR